MKYEIIENDFGQILKRDNEDGTISFIPMVAGNADYEAYLNPVELLTEISTGAKEL